MITINKEKGTTYSFTLKSKAGFTLLNSVTFPDKRALEKIISTLHSLLSHQNIFERKTDHTGNFLFHLKNNEGEIIGHSLLYSSEAGMENGIINLKKCITALPRTP